MQEKHLKKKEIVRKKDLHLYLKLTLGKFSASACANQPTNFSASKILTQEGIFQTINGLKRLMGYSKPLH